ncbi:hypothetical protein B0H11DRAFT_2111937, partial [Mycena galericulata]
IPMAPPSFAFARSHPHLILIPFFALQLSVSSAQAVHCPDGDESFDCNNKNEDPATQQRNRIIAASVAGVCLLLIAVAYVIYAYRKRRIRARRTVAAYPFASGPANSVRTPSARSARGRVCAWVWVWS